MGIKKVILYTIIVFISLSIIYPLFFTLITSLKDKQSYFTDIYGLNISSWSIENYIKMVKDFNVLQKMLNSVIVTAGGVLLTMAAAIPAAYSMNRISKRMLFILVTVLIIFAVIPEQVTVFSQYKLFLDLDLINNHLSVILSFSAKNLPEAIMFSCLFFRMVPSQIVDAARMEGCTEPRIMRSLFVPLCIPGLSVIAVSLMLGMWNSFLIPLVMLQNDNTKTIVTSLAMLDRRHGSNIPFQMAGNVFAMMPTLAFYAVFRKKITESVYENSLK